LKVLRRIFRRDREEVTGGWRTLHNEELHNSYSSPNTNKVIKLMSMIWEGHGKMRGAYRILVQKPKRKRPFG
jgi:hypothetical protein